MCHWISITCFYFICCDTVFKNIYFREQKDFIAKDTTNACNTDVNLNKKQTQLKLLIPEDVMLVCYTL